MFVTVKVIAVVWLCLFGAELFKLRQLGYNDHS